MTTFLPAAGPSLVPVTGRAGRLWGLAAPAPAPAGRSVLCKCPPPFPGPSREALLPCTPRPALPTSPSGQCPLPAGHLHTEDGGVCSAVEPRGQDGQEDPSDHGSQPPSGARRQGWPSRLMVSFMGAAIKVLERNVRIERGGPQEGLPLGAAREGGGEASLRDWQLLLRSHRTENSAQEPWAPP